ncbi:MAG: glycoside hydrolase family 127 protein [Candidatus Omnitrophica bacterium]|nr:glycoside hydrolase family 127 protein [Candidatus Omnitrophota bacterium]
MKTTWLISLILVGLIVVGYFGKASFAATITKGTVEATVARLGKTLGEDVLVSAGVPFDVGQLQSDRDISFFDGESAIPIATTILAIWTYDNSIRSVLVQFKLRMEEGNKSKPVVMKWGQHRKTKDIALTEVTWDIPEAYIVLPSQWLCDSEVVGEQVPMDKNSFVEYDKKLLSVYSKRKNDPYKRDVRKDFFYDTVHTFYQIYVRTGEPEYFVDARREAIKYRDDIIIREGPEKGNTPHKNPRYVFIQAMADDYLLTGDQRSLQVAGWMADYLKEHNEVGKAYYRKNDERFFTERRFAFPFLGMVEYYKLTHDEEYLNLASKFMENLYKTQKEWPERGGFIHNLYSHDPEEGARRDEYGGSPFMTGLLLEAIVEYHRLTGSEIAKESIFMALDWLMKEGLTSEGDSFYYTTADAQKSKGAHPDLNLLIVHAFGYGYKISGYTRKDYLDAGKRMFRRGVKSAFLGSRKHFNQNFRSSGHFLAYIEEGAL